MLHKLWVAMGFVYPTIDSALLTGKQCTRIGKDGYCVRSAAGFASALTHHMSRDYVTLGLDSDARTAVVERAKELDYPCVVWFCDDSFDSLPVDDPHLRYPTP